MDGFIDTQVITNASQWTAAIYGELDFPALGLWNSWIGWFSGNGKLRFTINAVDMANKEFLTNGYNIPVLGRLQGSYRTPRSVSATFGYTYN